MNLRKIIREEIENLPSFGESTCMLVHKSGNVFMSNHVDPNFYTTEEIEESLKDGYTGYFSIDTFCYPCDQQERRLNTLIRKVEAYEKYGHGQQYNSGGGVSLTRREPFEYDPREFEAVPYYKGLIPRTTSIFESEDFDWIRNERDYRGDYIIKRVGGRHTYVTVVEEYLHGPNNQPAIKYYIGNKLPVLGLRPNQGTMLLSTLQEKLGNGQWESLGTYTEPRKDVFESEDMDWIRDSGKFGNVSIGDKFIIYPRRSGRIGGFSSWEEDEYFIVQITNLDDMVHFVVVEYNRNVGDRKGEVAEMNWDSFNRVIETGYWTPIS